MPHSPTLADHPPIPPPLIRANSGVSLYQACLNLMDRLSGVPDFEQYLDPELLLSVQAGSSSTMSVNDPVSQLWVLFRLGTPLACIFNGLRPTKPLEVNNTNLTLSNINTCKASVFRFLVGCRQELQFKDEDLFTISELYQDDTNGFVKVIRTVGMVLDRMEAKGLLRAKRSKRNSDPAKPTDKRAKVVNEILETERSYVQDLENLQAYMRALQADGAVVSPEMIHLIFGNLNALVDFQRRFLIAVETNAALPPQEQNFGQVFLQHEEAFAVYEPFCANVKGASALVVQEYEKLQKMNHILDAQHGINSNLIKPVQRICKYPLLMHELIKLTDSEHPHYQGLLEGEACIKRVAEKVNETNRRQENQEIAMALQHQVAWKDGELVSDFGALLLHDTLLNPRGTQDKALEMYLFEKILVCCQKINRKKPTKSLTRSSKPKATLHLNGRIYINNIKSILPVSAAGSHVLHVVWNVAAEEFELRCRTEDQLKKWYAVLEKLVAEAKAERSDVMIMNNFMGASNSSRENPSSFFRDDDDYLDDDLEGDEEDAYDEVRSLRNHSLPSSQSSTHGSRTRTKTEDGVVPSYGRMSGSGGQGINGRSGTNGPYPRSSSSTGAWQRRSGGDGYSTMNDMSKHMGEDHIPGQPLARGGSAGYSYNATPPAAPPVPPIPGQLRVRAQSSPNIHAAPGGPSWSTAPEAAAHHRKPPTTSGPNSPTTPYPANAYSSVPVPSIPSSHASTRALQKQPSSGTLNANNGVPQLKVKVNFQEDSYLIVVPVQIGYNELIERVEKKIRLCGSRRNDGQPLRLRYKDEDNDYIIMKDDDDISLAFESCYACGVMNLHVS
ncbi:hypothetical protein BGX34_012019 [Mortierella sp. NVP85]|nr:hypothetical protein BGX34_012019 [Mortierella sp. NVP85]